MSRFRWMGVACALLTATATAEAQQATRVDLLQRATAAYDAFDLARATRLAHQAVDPSLGARDSVWTRGVHLLTQLLLESDQPRRAQLWARWATRLEPALPLDSAHFLARVVQTLRAARDSSAPRPSDAVVRERYVWPAATAPVAGARFRLGSSPMPVRVLVRGIGVLSPGEGVALDPGVYELEVSADGYLPVRSTREALPGVTTEFTFLLLPAAAAGETLASDARAHVDSSLVPLTVHRFGAAVQCAVGVVIGDDGRMLVPYESIRGADSIAIVGRSTNAVRVAAWDRSANLAVLSASGLVAPAISEAPDPMEGQAVFGLGGLRCGASEPARAVVGAGPAFSVALKSPAASLSTGAALVDFEGRFVGFYEDGVRVLGHAAFAPLLRLAEANLAGGVLRSPREVAESERQRFGVVVLNSPVRGASIRLEPLEAWHWPTLDTTGTAPLTFAGPAGRYRAHLMLAGARPQTEDITVVAGTRARSTLSGRAAAAAGAGSAPAGAAGARRRIPKWVWYTAAGVGVAAGLALGSGGGGSSAPSVVISVPNP